MKNHHPIPRAALDRHIAILGKTGSGKSNLAKTIAEDLMTRGHRVCVIDPTGTWWGLRLMADGRTPSDHPVVIFGGQHADLPVAAAHGEHIAQAIGTSSTPAIIDTRLLTVTDRTRFFTGFAETLIRANQGELTVIIDEAHLFMPQAGARVGGGAPTMLHAGNNLVSLGRGVGLRIILISQRPAKLHKDSLTQVETLVAMRLIAPQDRKAIAEWIDEWAEGRDGEGLTKSLPSLPTGDAWVWSPEIDHLERAHCLLAVTYDSGRVRMGEIPDLPPIDLSEVSLQLEQIGSDLLADDPKRLQRRIAELERELRAKTRAVVDETEVQQRIDAAVQEAIRQHARDYMVIGEKVAARLDELRRIVTEEFPPIEPAPAPPAPVRTPPTPSGETPKAANKGSQDAGRSSSNGLTGPQQRVLDALAWLADLGITDNASRIQVAFLAGYKPGGGAFNNTLGSLRSAGLISYPSSGEVALTDSGFASARHCAMPRTNEALQQAVLERLTGPQRRVLQPLIDHYPFDMGTEELAKMAGYEAGGGAFNNTRGSLRSLGLIAYPEAGRVVARRAGVVCE